MENALAVDWGAVAAIGTLLAVVVAWLQLRHAMPRTHRNRDIKISISESKGKILEGLKEGGSQRLTMEKVQIENISGNDLSNVSLFISPVNDIWSMEVQKTKQLAKEAVELLIIEKSLIINIDDMPKGESIEIDVLSNDFYFSFERVKSKNSNAVVKMA